MYVFAFSILELKCSVCGKRADGVCALCLVTRFCKSCFENKHKNSPFEEDPNNIHKLTLYVRKNKSFMLKPFFFFRKKLEKSILHFYEKKLNKGPLFQREDRRSL